MGWEEPGFSGHKMGRPLDLERGSRPGTVVIEPVMRVPPHNEHVKAAGRDWRLVTRSTGSNANWTSTRRTLNWRRWKMLSLDPSPSAADTPSVGRAKTGGGQ